MRASGVKDDKPSNELVMFMMNAAGLHDEVIDFCQ
jgi:hypothetical protein